MSRNLICLIALAIAVGCIPNVAKAQIDWSNTTNNNPFFHIGSNWVGGNPPGASDTARFNRFGTYEVWWDATTAANIPSISGITMPLGNVTFENKDLVNQHRFTCPNLSLSGPTTSLRIRGLDFRIYPGEITLNSGASLIVDGSHPLGTGIFGSRPSGGSNDNRPITINGEFRVLSGAIASVLSGKIGYGQNTFGTAIVDGAGSVWSTNQLYVGYNGGTGNLLISNGGRVDTDPFSYQSQAFIAELPGSTGSVVVSGEGSLLDCGTENYQDAGIHLAWQGNGDLTIEDGGKVITRKLKAGYLGECNVNISTGGQLIASQVRFGEAKSIDSPLVTIANISGIGTVVECGHFYVSPKQVLGGNRQDRDAFVEVREGANVNSGAISIAEGSSIGDLLVTGNGTQLIGSGALIVAKDGGSGSGLLTVEDGAFSSTGRALIGYRYGIGRIEISGTGTQWLNSEDLIIGGGSLPGIGFLDVKNGSVVSIGTSIAMGQNGHLTISDASAIVFGACLMDGTFTVSNSAQAYGVTFQCAGVTTNSGGTIDLSNRFDVEPNGELRGFGIFEATAGWINDGTMSFNGGNSTVTGPVNNSDTSSMSFAADSQVTFSNAVTNSLNTTTGFELGGTNIGELGQMICTDDFAIDGVLSVTLADGFDLDYEQTFLIVNNGGAASGIFDNLPEGAVVGNYNGIDLRITYAAGDGNDIALFTDPAPISPTLPMGRKFLDGFDVSGNLGSIHASNDQYWQIEPSPTTNPAKQKVDLMLLGTSPVTSPNTFSFRLESRMTGGDPGPVIQQVFFITPSNNRKVLIDSRPVTNGDVSIIITPTGNLNRFVNPLNGDVIVKVTYITDPSGPLFEWDVEIDEAVWLIE